MYATNIVHPILGSKSWALAEQLSGGLKLGHEATSRGPRSTLMHGNGTMYWGAKRKTLREVSDSSDEAEQKKTCGSTVFSTGHPRQYSLAPAMLVCADRTRRGRFIAVWPQMKCTHSASYTYPFALPHLRQSPPHSPGRSCRACSPSRIRRGVVSTIDVHAYMLYMTSAAARRMNPIGSATLPTLR
jgi:hypothetical protein